MTSSLSSLVYNLFERIHRIKYKYGHDNKQYKTCGITYKKSDCSLEYTNFKDDLTEYKCLYCNKNYQKEIGERLNERSFNTYMFSNNDSNKFTLLLDDW